MAPEAGHAGAAPNLLSSPLVLTCTSTGSGSRPTASTALSSLLASCAPQKSTFWFTDRSQRPTGPFQRLQAASRHPEHSSTAAYEASGIDFCRIKGSHAPLQEPRRVSMRPENIMEVRNLNCIWKLIQLHLQPENRDC